MPTRPAFTCGAFFGGELYLGGPAGLNIYTSGGEPRRTLRTGMELPTAPIVAMASGRLRGAPEAQLLLATAGAGLLVLSAGDARAGGGPRVEQMLPANREARDLTAVLPLSTGEVLLGTRHGGAQMFDGVTLAPVRFRLEGVDPGRVEVTALAASGAASFLIGTRGAGVIVLRGGIAQRRDASSGLPDNQVESIVTEGGRAFVGTPLGVAELDPEAAEPRVLRTLAPGVFSRALAWEPGSLTIGSMDQGIRQLRLEASAEGGAHLLHAALALPGEAENGGSVSGFLRSREAGSPLFAIVDGGLRMRGPGGWTEALQGSHVGSAAEASALTDRDVSALAFDAGGRLYVGYFDRGLDVVSPGGAVRHLEDDHLFCVNRLALDPERSTMAAATANGLVLFDGAGTPRQVLTRRDGLISDHVTDVAFSPEGTTVATPAGLTMLKATGAESLYAFQGLVNNHVYALAAGPGPGELLAGTLGGLSQLRGGAVRRNYTASNSGLRHNWITALAASPDGSTLVGTYGAGVLRFVRDKDGSARFAPVDLPGGSGGELVINPNAILATRAHVYAGTLGHGMLVYSTQTGRWTAVTRGLPSLNVTAFAEREDTLYVATANGLVSIREARLP